MVMYCVFATAHLTGTNALRRFVGGCVTDSDYLVLGVNGLR